MAEKTKRMSDMMLHYLSITEQYNDCIIFYRLGDFYEMFFEDAVEASQILELTLTGRDCGLEERAPMCGVPYHAADSYIAKLVAHGKKVAICEQLTLPGEQKGLVKRDVIRIVSNGTMTETDLFDEKKNNFICSICLSGDDYAFSWADITTGDCFTYESKGKDDILNTIQKVLPSQIICNSEAMKYLQSLDQGVAYTLPIYENFSDDMYSYQNAKKTLKERFGLEDLSSLILDDKKLALCAAGALISYIDGTQKRKVDIISSIQYYTDVKHLVLDSVALKNLEISQNLRDGKEYGTLLWALDNTLTAGGGRKLREMIVSPLKDVAAVNYRLDGVADLIGDTMRLASLSDVLKGVKDLERLCGRLSNGILNPRDCLQIRLTLGCIPSIKMQLVGMNSKVLKDIFANLGVYDDLVTLLTNVFKDNPPVTTRDGNFVRDGFDEKLDHYRKIKYNAKEMLDDLADRERKATGIKTLKIGYNKIFGYYIEVSNSYLQQVPYKYIRKQTLVGGERFITEELKKLEEEILTADEQILKIENDIFKKIQKVLGDRLSDMLKTARCLSMLDVILNFAYISKKRNYSRPTMLDYNGTLNIVGGRHPVVEVGSKVSFIPNDTVLDSNENRMMIITGPNMAGKSTYMRQVALIVIMAHIGCFVSAKSAEIPLVDRIFTRVGASDNLLFNQSTFMVEMSEVASIAKNATEHSLLVMDEVGRGTSTFDGLSIAWAVVEYLALKLKAKTLFATHYHELSEIEGSIDGVKNYKITVKEINGEIVFMRKIVRGSANKSFGIEVAALSGVPKEITDRAKKILSSLEKNDITVKSSASSEPTTNKEKSFVENYLDKLDLNNVTPLKAFEILAFLKSKTEE